ncbi:hypothetical protein IEO21_08328 [Rhodonia placenta]|uniref:G-protein coupled receptors family 1 profile domain-containing protein n=2 Tax=Rhodonia placenta TaxID=104341 RepID=A0A1X6N2A8_9APHY|nr:hypothetical protein POSPLADRAFT_1046056 [Postia placenta MAD-698-R-SB12]KAF9807191.1 hypothetical protein IEO21_08328 [Postia placenta]OSX62606.1 hypothetical protein POSPLADRAFT_1046056 [Postia placenta MAD-698-R-SB12]
MPELITGPNARTPIVATMLEGITYGIATCVFAMTVWVLYLRRDRGVSRWMLGVALVLWILPTIRVIIDTVDTVNAFVHHMDEGPSGPSAYLASFWRPLSLLDNALYAISTLIGDAVVIYRCYVVWQSWLVIVIPGLAWLGSLGSTIYILHSFHEHIISSNQIVMLYSFTLAANLSATAALAYRIWSVDRQTIRPRGARTNLRPILLVVMESAAMYTSLLIAALVTVEHALQAEYCLNTSMPSLISVIFGIVFIRMGLAQLPKEGRAAAGHIPLSTIVFDSAPTQTVNQSETKYSRSEMSSGMTFKESSAVESVV